jgi:hypothetical protein
MARNEMAERTFQDIYDRLSIEHNNIITRDVFHQEVYKDIVKLCAMVATAHSRQGDDIGEIILKTLGVK